MDKSLYTFDIETYFDTFLFAGQFHNHGPQVFEISWRNNHSSQLYDFLSYLRSIDAHMVGYNNIQFDYPIIHEFMLNPSRFTAKTAFDAAQKIISTQKYRMNPRGIGLKDRLIHQIDLMKIWHYDNDNKRTRLKDLEFAMRAPNVMDLPFDFRKPLNSDQIDKLIEYNVTDVRETDRFLGFTMERIQLRRDLIKSGSLYGDVMNWNDTKLGEQFFISKLGRNLCYHGSKPKGTERFRVDFKDVILPKIGFRTEPFREVLDLYQEKYWIKDDKDHNKTIPFKRQLGNLEFAFGSGGVHASVSKKIYHTNATHKIIDVDVSGYYPAVGITNKFYPEHLGEKFVEVYKQLKADRKQYAKGTAMNAVLKLAQNGTYGKSNSEYSPIFDIRYLFSITINGQLQLLQLAEMFALIPGLELIQCNTDGITAYVPREYEVLFKMWKDEWQVMTGYELEEVEYKSMFIRDVNSYIAVKTDGKVKRKGAYWFGESWKDYDDGPGHWHTDLSQTIVQKVAERVMLHGENPEAALYDAIQKGDPFDFMIRLKVIGEQKGYLGDREIQKTFRYYVSTQGEPLKVIRPASGPVGQYKRKPKITDKLYSEVMNQIGPNVWDARIHTGKAGKPDTQGKYVDTETNICSGFKVRDCCLASEFRREDVDVKYYLEEVQKLIIGG